jgi:UDP-N-acetylmuramoylalanine-D-glutamate ligase
MVAQVLSSYFVTAKTPANHNNDIGMPMAILSMELDTQVAVLEMGMNHFREIAYLSEIAHPDIAVIMNIGTTHMEYLGSQKGIRKAKMEIVEGMDSKGLLLLNGDDVLLRHLDSQPLQRITYFGRTDGCAVQAHDICQEGEVLRFRAEAGKLTRLTEDRAISLEQLGRELQDVRQNIYLVGDGSLLTYRTLQPTVSRLVLPAEHRMHQRATGVGLAAAAMIEAGLPGDAGSLTPNYLRLSQAERERLEKEKKEKNQ